jgi:phosphatidylserine/phosphatidylglycerophosphate/cardiolipin synthase-like enzyme
LPRAFILGAAAVALAALATVAIDLRSAAREPTTAGVRLYYGPSPELEAADLAALASAKRSIDMAAYLLTDRDIIAALAEAARRGVAIRLYLDRDEMAQPPVRAAQDLAALAAQKGVAIRFKASHSEAMHLKSYLVDRRLLRTGSANFTRSGETLQDNDVVLIESPALAGAFAKTFEKLWARPDNEAWK